MRILTLVVFAMFTQALLYYGDQDFNYPWLRFVAAIIIGAMACTLEIQIVREARRSRKL